MAGRSKGGIGFGRPERLPIKSAKEFIRRNPDEFNRLKDIVWEINDDRKKAGKPTLGQLIKNRIASKPTIKEVMSEAIVSSSTTSAPIAPPPPVSKGRKMARSKKAASAVNKPRAPNKWHAYQKRCATKYHRKKAKGKL